MPEAPPNWPSTPAGQTRRERSPNSTSLPEKIYWTVLFFSFSIKSKAISSICSMAALMESSFVRVCSA